MELIERISPQVRAERDRMRMECRANGHTMRAAPAPPGWFPPNAVWRGAKRHLHRRCRECGTWHHIAMRWGGGRVAAYYDWPDWCRQEPGEGRIPSEKLRLWELEQVEGLTKAKRRTA